MDILLTAKQEDAESAPVLLRIVLNVKVVIGAIAVTTHSLLRMELARLVALLVVLAILNLSVLPV